MKVSILGRSIQINRNVKQSEDEEWVGQYSSLHRVIRVVPHENPQYEADTLLHELLHACFDASGLRGTSCTKHEEQIVELLTPAVLSLVADNPEVVRILRKLWSQT